MLTTLEANFVTEYQLTGNATQAYKAAGFPSETPTNIRVKAHRLLKKPEIVTAIETQQCNMMKQLTTPQITTIVTEPKKIVLPTREEYAETAWKRSSDESKLKDDLKHKYFETAGKVLRHIGNDEGNNSGGDVLQILCKELNISLSQNPDSQTPQVVVDSDIRLTENISDGKNIHTPSLSDIEGDTSNKHVLDHREPTAQAINNTGTPQNNITEGKKIE